MSKRGCRISGADAEERMMKHEPAQIAGLLFEAVQQARIFPDSKTFTDCRARFDDAHIQRAFMQQLRDFVGAHFELPAEPPAVALVDSASLAEHIDRLWTLLERAPQAARPGSSAIALAHPHVVPGGRFGEIYYWDSYFTAEGLAVSGRLDLVEGLIRNFADLIERFGYVPNGTRLYYLGRSQPPMFCALLQLLERHRGFDAIRPFLPQLVREYAFWMDPGFGTQGGQGAPTDTASTGWPRAGAHVVELAPGELLNRYWDASDSARPESFAEDLHTRAQAPASRRASILRDIRAGAESGWDFSSRWFGPGGTLAHIRTTELLAVDLNALLWEIECRLADWLGRVGDDRAPLFAAAAARRRALIQAQCWDASAGWFFDRHWPSGARSEAWTLAGAFALYCGLVDEEQAARMAEVIESRFLRPGGVVTTLERSGEQWDAPNGWAPLHWIVVQGLRRYGHHRLADDIAERFIGLVERVWRRTGKMMEKYDVCDMALEAGGGEYPVQDGFGWTNGVVRALLAARKGVRG
ncbi:trehalase family glycosidase [Thauera sp. WH-1]|uniref:trehalase family glycosidase n=1 Tax=Thauera sp. WH-1 TaxID=3398230 RepID=UPI0039FC87C1